MKTRIAFGDAARESLLAGMEAVYKAVYPTLGSASRHAALTRWQKPLIINDGVTIARKIVLEDAGQNMGADFIKEVAERTNEEAGDGTTTSVTLAFNLISQGFELINKSKESPLKIRKEMEDALDMALKLLDEQAIKISSDSELTKIAKISSDNEYIAELVTLAFKQAGDTGRVVVEESQGLKTVVEKIPGMEVEGGYISPFFITNPDKSEAVLDNPYVLVTDKTFVLQNDLIPLMEEMAREGKRSLVIVCKDAQSEALGMMVGNKVNGKFNVIAVRAPRDKEMLKDLANLCGKQEAWTDENTVKKIALHSCSKIQKVVAYKDRTLFIKGERTDIEKSYYNERVDTLKALIKESHNDEKTRYEDRLARLTGSVVLIRVGASSSTEIVYERLKIEDAVNAVKSAVKEGYTVGGGVALLTVGRKVYETLKTNGAHILASACEMPIRVLVQNSGAEWDADKVADGHGFNSDTGRYEKNLMDKGIIDPILVEKRALSNAVSLAGLILTLETLITDVVEPAKSGV